MYNEITSLELIWNYFKSLFLFFYFFDKFIFLFLFGRYSKIFKNIPLYLITERKRTTFKASPCAISISAHFDFKKRYGNITIYFIFTSSVANIQAIHFHRLFHNSFTSLSALSFSPSKTSLRMTGCWLKTGEI